MAAAASGVVRAADGGRRAAGAGRGARARRASRARGAAETGRHGVRRAAGAGDALARQCAAARARLGAVRATKCSGPGIGGSAGCRPAPYASARVRIPLRSGVGTLRICGPAGRIRRRCSPGQEGWGVGRKVGRVGRKEGGTPRLLCGRLEGARAGFTWRRRWRRHRPTAARAAWLRHAPAPGAAGAAPAPRASLPAAASARACEHAHAAGRRRSGRALWPAAPCDTRPCQRMAGQRAPGASQGAAPSGGRVACTAAVAARGGGGGGAAAAGAGGGAGGGGGGACRGGLGGGGAPPPPPPTARAGARPPPPLAAQHAVRARAGGLPGAESLLRPRGARTLGEVPER
jgi:hypothetical protein